MKEVSVRSYNLEITTDDDFAAVQLPAVYHGLRDKGAIQFGPPQQPSIPRIRIFNRPQHLEIYGF